MSEPLLTIDRLQTFIGQFHILQDVSLSVPVGSITVLLGRNGAGKTTTLKTIMALTPAREGTIHFAGQPITRQRPYHVARLGIGYVPEHRAIFAELSVRENLEIAERQRGDLKKRLDFIFGLFPDLQRLYALPGGRLSGGQQQMLAIARALVPDNRLLLIDEPSEGLAPVVIEQLIGALRQLAAHATVLLVEQNFRMARQLADHYAIIDDGRTVSAGTMPDLLANPATIQQYLGAA